MSEHRTFQIQGLSRTFADLHRAGDPACTADLCQTGNPGPFGSFPRRCVCGGLIHAAIDASTFNDSHGGIDSQCDSCEEPQPADE